MLFKPPPLWGEFQCKHCVAWNSKTNECHYKAPSTGEYVHVDAVSLAQWPQTEPYEYCYEGYEATKKLRREE
jgi:hypothetical protein